MNRKALRIVDDVFDIWFVSGVFLDKIELYLAFIRFFVDIIRHFFELISHHLFVKPVVRVFLRQKLLVDNFKSVTHSVVLSFKCAAAGKNGIIYAFY
jgi:hypothetical protein